MFAIAVCEPCLTMIVRTPVACVVRVTGTLDFRFNPFHTNNLGSFQARSQVRPAARPTLGWRSEFRSGIGANATPTRNYFSTRCLHAPASIHPDREKLCSLGQAIWRVSARRQAAPGQSSEAKMELFLTRLARRAYPFPLKTRRSTRCCSSIARRSTRNWGKSRPSVRGDRPVSDIAPPRTKSPNSCG